MAIGLSGSQAYDWSSYEDIWSAAVEATELCVDNGHAGAFNTFGKSRMKRSSLHISHFSRSTSEELVIRRKPHRDLKAAGLRAICTDTPVFVGRDGGLKLIVFRPSAATTVASS